MVEISLSGSGEGPGWETSWPTLQRASPPALWVSGSRRAKTYAKGIAIREHTELQTLPRRPVSIIGPDMQCSTYLFACYSEAVTVSQ